TEVAAPRARSRPAPTQRQTELGGYGSRRRPTSFFSRRGFNASLLCKDREYRMASMEAKIGTNQIVLRESFPVNSKPYARIRAYLRSSALAEAISIALSSKELSTPQ